MEAVIKYSSVHDNECNGCIRHESDIMVTFATDPTEPECLIGTQFNDFFLTEEQANWLVTEGIRVHQKK